MRREICIGHIISGKYVYMFTRIWHYEDHVQEYAHLQCIIYCAQFCTQAYSIIGATPVVLQLQIVATSLLDFFLRVKFTVVPGLRVRLGRAPEREVGCRLRSGLLSTRTGTESKEYNKYKKFHYLHGILVS